MPSRFAAKRSLEEIVNQEDSDDDDYDDRAPGPSSARSRTARSRGNNNKPAKKRKRGGYRGSDVESDGDSLLEDDYDSSGDEDIEEEIETNEKGRPVRRAAKHKVMYEENSEDEESERSNSSEDELLASAEVTNQSLVVKLKISPQATSSLPAEAPARSSVGAKGPAGSRAPPMRRSSRLSHDEDEALIGLTNSGRHTEITRPGSRGSEDPSRIVRGGKTIKYPSKSTIDEDVEPESGRAQVEAEEMDMEIGPSQQEILDSAPGSQIPAETDVPRVTSDVLLEETGAKDDGPDKDEDDEDPLHRDEGDEDDEDVPLRRGRLTRGSAKRKADSPLAQTEPTKRLRSDGTSSKTRKRGQDESSDFDPDGEGGADDNMSSSGESDESPRKSTQRNDGYDSSHGRRSNRLRRTAVSARTSVSGDEDEELAAELADLKKDRPRRRRPSNEEIIFETRGARRGQKKPNYDLLRNLAPIEDDEELAVPSPSNRARKPGGGSWQSRQFFNTYGPFGGGGGAAPVLGGPYGPRAQGDVDSDSSDDEVMRPPRPIGGAVGMTPTQPSAGGLNPFAVQPLNQDALQSAGTPANLGKIKDKQALADADPLGVDQNVNFDGVGGLQGHIDQLKEMVALPLLYPEIFMRFKITPPRGVLFHGPPGTGKTLLARALASSVSSQGRKVTFYMRKGADALSKWVGEAERQLRLLFEEARKNQPSIIFFDEIDGLAPVRSSKQEQIHASIVSTLLALMDGMDGRGQVIVIGATNRPDSIDPALRRPGRFDREFYFPLPNRDARRAILEIHTKGWNPPLAPEIKDELAEVTKGYGGADLRALCTEAALNAVQRRYPQIYQSKEKLLIDPKTIEVTPKDFMISVKKMVPSSERSTSSGAAPLPSSIAPLLQKPVDDIKRLLAEILPQKKNLTALEEAQFEDVADGHSFGRERMQQAFENARVFRPRLLIHGRVGMGQHYIAAALLNHFEGLHVQPFDLATLLSDSTASPESTVIRLFAEVKRHKPSVIYIPSVQEWYGTVGPSVLSTFFGLLRSLKPTDPILVLGLLEGEPDEGDRTIQRELFGYSKKNQYELHSPGNAERHEFFSPLRGYVQTAPSDFPDPKDRKRRTLELLKPAPPEPERQTALMSKEEMKTQKKRDRQTLNMLKIRLQPIMDQIRTRHKKFRTGVIEESQIRYLFEEADPGTVSSDLHTDLRAQASFRPFEIGRDGHGVPGLIEQASSKFFYNLDSVTIEKRLSNGYYKRPKDFLADIRRLAKDAKTIGDEDRLLKANELLANVEVDIGGIEMMEPAFAAECEKVYQRELTREKEAAEKAKAAEDENAMPPPQMISNVPHGSVPSSTTATTDGPIVLGEAMPTAKDMLGRLAPVTPSRPRSNGSNLTNGILQITNGGEHGSGQKSTQTGSGHEADGEVDSQAGNTNSHPTSGERSNETQGTTTTTSSFDNRGSAQPRPFHSYTAPSQQLRREAGMSAPLSQTEFMTPMQPGSVAADYQNDASTTQTTSGKKNSGPSSSERDQNQNNTQDSGPNLYLFEERRSAGGSEIPDTQENQPFSQPSTASQPHSGPELGIQSPQVDAAQLQLQRHSAPPIPAFDGSNSQPRTNGHLANILNPPPVPNLIQAEVAALDRMIQEIAARTSGMSVEQLEQVNSVLMDTIWRTRDEWNRLKVMNLVIEAFNEVTDDMMRAGQDLGESSWGKITNIR